MTEPTKLITFDVRHCSRCEQDHQQLEAKEFMIPIDDSDGPWTHWARCPISGDPILVKLVKLEKVKR